MSEISPDTTSGLWIVVCHWKDTLSDGGYAPNFVNISKSGVSELATELSSP